MAKVKKNPTTPSERQPKTVKPRLPGEARTKGKVG